jgi:nitrogen fixation/metabolism regulation signal transduction histidine kinase
MSRDLREARKQRLIAERRATWQRVARIIAHEIKNPLTPIKLSTERMYEKFAAGSGDFPAVLKSTTTTILSEIANLRKLVETFHRYAKFPDPVLRRGDLNAVIGEVCAMFEGETARIEVASAERLPPVDIDAGQIREALTNLVRNALDAVGDSPGQGVVCVRSLCRVDQVVVEIADNGCGIAPEHRDNLFQPYFTTKEHGNGIGLALTERIISLHGGTIGFEGEPGEGTTFYVALPAVGAGVAGDTETNNG